MSSSSSSSSSSSIEKVGRSIFFSWQSDLPNNVGRTFIFDCLKDAVTQLNARKGSQFEYSCTEGMRDEGGAKSIPQTLMRKIKDASIVIVDATLVHPNTLQIENGRPAPNPNVMFELGYAVGLRGWERVVILCNESYCKVEDLPFDIRQNRVAPFAKKDSVNIAARDTLEKVLKFTQWNTAIESGQKQEIENVMKILDSLVPASQAPTASKTKEELKKTLFASIESIEKSEDDLPSWRDKILAEVAETNRKVEEQSAEIKSSFATAEAKRLKDLMWQRAKNIQIIEKLGFNPFTGPLMQNNPQLKDSTIWQSWINSNCTRSGNDMVSGDILTKLNIGKVSGDITILKIIEEVEKYYTKLAALPSYAGLFEQTQ